MSHIARKREIVEGCSAIAAASLFFLDMALGFVMDGTIGQTLLGAFGTRIGIEGLVFEDGQACLGFDAIELNIEYKISENIFLVYAEVDELAGRIPEAVLLDILAMNYGLAMTARGAIVLDTENGKLLFVRHFPIGTMTDDTFATTIEQFVNSTETVIEAVREALTATPVEASVSAGDEFQIFRP
jgi:hypothetical protein